MSRKSNKRIKYDKENNWEPLVTGVDRREQYPPSSSSFNSISLIQPSPAGDTPTVEHRCSTLKTLVFKSSGLIREPLLVAVHSDFSSPP